MVEFQNQDDGVTAENSGSEINLDQTSIRSGLPMKASLLHEKSRLDHPDYLEVGLKRIQVPDNKVPWEIAWPEYDTLPTAQFDHPYVLEKWEKEGASGWAQSADISLIQKDSLHSYCGDVRFNKKGLPLNPMGRTGIPFGRGLLGRWGANFTADPIILRRDPASSAVQVLLIKRKDTGDWALPGGMVDFGETVGRTLSRELEEETGAVIDMSDAVEVYRGYADDPRNTDNAWLETVAAMKFLSEEQAEALELRAGSDAAKYAWVEVEESLMQSLYGGHAGFLRLAMQQIESSK